MIMHQSYRDDLKDHILDTNEQVFLSVGLTRQNILNDDSLMERLWALYQKSIEDYDVDADFAYRDAMKDVLNITIDNKELSHMWYVLYKRTPETTGEYQSVNFPEQAGSIIDELLSNGVQHDEILVFYHDDPMSVDEFRTKWL